MENKADRGNDTGIKNNDVGTQPNPANLEDVLETLPPEKRDEYIERFMLQAVRYSETNTDMAISEKITSDHITAFINGQLENMRLNYAENRGKRKFALIIFVIAVITILTIIIVLMEKPDVMEKIIYYLLSLCTGFIGGYGLGNKKGKEDKE